VVQGVKGLILVGALFLLDGGAEEREKRGCSFSGFCLEKAGFCWDVFCLCSMMFPANIRSGKEYSSLQ
jgi:hypothetical protein